MTRSSVIVLALSGSVATAATGFYVIQQSQQEEAASAAPQRSFARGIFQTQDAINRINEALQQNIRSGDEFVSETAPMVASDLVGNLGFARLQRAIDTLARADSSINAINKGNYPRLVTEALEALLETYGEARLPGSTLAGGGLKGVNMLAWVTERYVVLRERKRLLATKHLLEHQLEVLEGKQYEATGRRATFADLFDDDDALDRVLGLNPLEMTGVFEAVKADLISSGREGIFQEALGGEIVDPDSINFAFAQEINPDWIAAVHKCRQAARTLNFALWGTCDKYPDGSYVHAFLSTSNVASTEASSVLDPVKQVDQCLATSEAWSQNCEGLEGSEGSVCNQERFIALEQCRGNSVVELVKELEIGRRRIVCSKAYEACNKKCNEIQEPEFDLFSLRGGEEFRACGAECGKADKQCMNAVQLPY